MTGALHCCDCARSSHEDSIAAVTCEQEGDHGFARPPRRRSSASATSSSPASATAPCSSPARASSGRRRTGPPRSPCCARPSTSASTTSIPPTSTVRTSPTKSSARRSPRIRTICTSSRRSVPAATSRAAWPHARTPAELREQVHDNLRRLGLDVLDVVNLRVGGIEAPEPGSIAEQFEALAELRRAGADPAPGPQHRHRRAARRGAGDRARRLRAEHVQHRPPRRRRPRRPHRPAGHRVRAVFPARRLLATAVGRPAGRRRRSWTRRRWPSRWPGCCAARRTSC